MKKLIQIAFALVLITVLTGCVDFGRARATTTVRESVDHVPASALTVESRNGGVEIVASSEFDAVDIEARIQCSGTDQAEADERVSQATLEVSRGTSRGLTIRPVFPGGARGGDGASITVHLPDLGDVNITTSNGPVRVTGGGGTLVAHTSNGPVRVHDHIGGVRIQTSNGTVNIERQQGDVDVETSNASVTLTNLDGAPKVRTSNGSITLALHPAHAGPVALRTSNASIRMTVGPAFAGSMTLSTSNASVNVDDHAGIVRLHSSRNNRAELSMGDADQQSTVRTSNGRVTLTIEP